MFTWENGRIPFGIVAVADDKWIYGSLPDALNKLIIAGVRERSLQSGLKRVKR